jgi:hypothetical protein
VLDVCLKYLEDLRYTYHIQPPQAYLMREAPSRLATPVMLALLKRASWHSCVSTWLSSFHSRTSLLAQTASHKRRFESRHEDQHLLHGCSRGRLIRVNVGVGVAWGLLAHRVASWVFMLG